MLYLHTSTEGDFIAGGTVVRPFECFFDVRQLVLRRLHHLHRLIELGRLRGFGIERFQKLDDDELRQRVSGPLGV